MSSDIDPSTVPPMSKREAKRTMKRLEADIKHFDEVARTTPNDRLALVAFGISAGMKTMSKHESMSHFAWIALGQLFTQNPGVYDGDLITKTGRTELVELGLAERVPAYGVKDLMLNRLTTDGMAVAARVKVTEAMTQ